MPGLLEQRERSPVGQLVLSPGGEVLDLNDMAAHLLVVDRKAVGLPLRALLVDDDGPAVQAHLQTALARDGGRRVDELEVTPRWERGRRLALTSRRGRERDASLCFTAVHDVSARVREDQALRLLAALTSVTCSLDPAAVVARLCRVLVPALADLAVADVVVDGARLDRRASVCHVDAERGRRFRASEERWGPLPNVAFQSLEALRDARVTRLPEVTARYMQLAALDADHLSAVVSLALRSWLFVPLLDRDRRPLAVIRLATAGTRRAFDDEDLALAEKVGHVASLALANAQAHARLAAAVGSETNAPV